MKCSYYNQYATDAFWEEFMQRLKNGLAPAELAKMVFEGIRAKRLTILTSEEFDEMILRRAENITGGENPAF